MKVRAEKNPTKQAAQRKKIARKSRPNHAKQTKLLNCTHLHAWVSFDESQRSFKNYSGRSEANGLKKKIARIARAEIARMKKKIARMGTHISPAPSPEIASAIASASPEQIARVIASAPKNRQHQGSSPLWVMLWATANCLASR